MIGLRFGWMLGSTVLVETVFDWPGIGLYAAPRPWPRTSSRSSG